MIQLLNKSYSLSLNEMFEEEILPERVQIVRVYTEPNAFNFKSVLPQYIVW